MMFQDRRLWPEFLALSEELHAHLAELAERVLPCYGCCVLAKRLNVSIPAMTSGAPGSDVADSRSKGVWNAQTRERWQERRPP
jgi:hypothetical protein